MRKTPDIPLSLYIHTPWCVKKCPYCDFNSHPLHEPVPETIYKECLIADLQSQLDYVQDRSIHSIFIGGGTPSLLSDQFYSNLFSGLNKRLSIPANTEITLEANPGALEQQRFSDYRSAGVNRLSIGVQSFQDDKLLELGRIHDSEVAIAAIRSAKWAGFTNFNIDLMFGLPNQTVADAMYDLQTALDLEPAHLSWYQLTIEPNTYFSHYPPDLPDEETISQIQQAGYELLRQYDFKQYEVSAFCQSEYECQHNLNYWQFGDYLAIGAGAHAKVTDLNSHTITRYWNIKHPKHYLSATNQFHAERQKLTKSQIPFEFMLNALRLYQPIPFNWFEQRTGLHRDCLLAPLSTGQELELLNFDTDSIHVTEHGRNFLNDAIALFLKI